MKIKQLKTRIVTLLTVGAVYSTSAITNWVTIDGRRWKYDDDGWYYGTYQILGVSPSRGDVVIPSTIPGKGTVDRIAGDAFTNCTDMTSITIPSTIKGPYPWSAFDGCTALDGVIVFGASPSLAGSGNAQIADYCPNLKWAVVNLPTNPFSPSVNVFNWVQTSEYRPGGYDEDGMSKSFSITPTRRNFGVNGGYGSIVTSAVSDGGTWTADYYDSLAKWVRLNVKTGAIGTPVAYMVDATTNVEQRSTYITIEDRSLNLPNDRFCTHAIVQDGLGATISPSGITVEGGGAINFGTIAVETPANYAAWHAHSGVDWILLDATGGVGSGTIGYCVLPYDEVSTRSATITIAGNTFSVYQYGRRMKLDSYGVAKDYQTHMIEITVNALATTQWSVTPNNSWISVVDDGNGQGGDLVSIAIAENPSYRARTGTVTIGTETFTVTQEGRPTSALSLEVNPANSTASENGANATIEVHATPDLPWTATSDSGWLSLVASTARGTGNGNIIYSASPNTTLSQRTGTLTVTPDPASGVSAKTHTVTQPGAPVAISMNSYEFEAGGEACSVDVSCRNNISWSISKSDTWIVIVGQTGRVGPGTVTLQAEANDTIYPRSGTVTIAGQTFWVSQKARGVELEYDSRLFPVDGDGDSISVHPDGNISWTAVSSDSTWITVWEPSSGTGEGEVFYTVAPYIGSGGSRTGWITIGNKKVYITQRAYDLFIEPNGTNVTGNAGAGEFGVSATIGDVWNAIVTEPWITIISGYNSGTGSGTVRFLYEENGTGKTRTGKIIVNGEVYTLTQRARQMVAITAMAEHGGHVSGGGSYDLGSQATLTAVPDSGYAFSYWTGAVSSMQNPLVVTVDAAKSYTAVFAPLPIAFSSVESSVDGVSLAWNNLAWAGTYRIYRGVASVPSSATVLAELPNNGNCTYLDETGDVGVEYWYWIEAEGPSDEVMSNPMTGRKERPVVMSPITYENLHGAANPNPATYREGELLSFQNPGTVTGYTFAGWTPAQISADMTGGQTVRAAWTANRYSIAYNPNGGSGTTDATVATYDSEATIADNEFTWTGHTFVGWATNETGAAVYAAGQAVTNLTAQSGGVVTLYAVWELSGVAPPEITPGDGASFVGDSCLVTITCATPDAIIYCTTNGSNPKTTETNRYKGPFEITATTTVKAIAKNANDDQKSSVTTATITKAALTYASAMGADGLTFTSSGANGVEWVVATDATADGGVAVRSGEIGNSDNTWIETTVSGSGTFSFKWRADCEDDDTTPTSATWDHLRVETNGTEVTRIDGVTGWLGPVSISIVGGATIRWTFEKDDSDAGGSDCVWIDSVVWSPAGAPPDPIPEIAGDSDVAGALAGSSDSRLAKYIRTLAEYNAYRGWVNAKGLDHQTVKASSRAWLSYALDANGLIERMFQKGDVIIETFSPTSGSAFSFEVSIAGVAIGSGATAENLARVFGIEGSESLNGNAFSSANVNATLAPSAGGGLSVIVTPSSPRNTFFVRVRMYADAEDGEIPSGDTHDKVQLWDGGPYWATTNIGAEEPEEYGYYFWWGDTVGYKCENDALVASDGSSSNFSFSSDNTPTINKSVDILESEGWITADGVLAPAHDAAHVKWGGAWRMPTIQELEGLIKNCYWTWTMKNGVSGYEVRGQGSYASNSIFLPAAGNCNETSLEHAGSSCLYWSSTPLSGNNMSYGLNCYSTSHTDFYFRNLGRTIRPVQSCAE